MFCKVNFKSPYFCLLQNDPEDIEYSLKMLTTFIKDNLRAKGLKIKDTYAEDWGWCIEIAHDEKYFLAVGCAVMLEGNNTDNFVCFIIPNKPYIRRFFKKINTRPNILLLYQTLNEILMNTEYFSDICWSQD